MKYIAPNGETIEFENDSNIKNLLEAQGFKPVEEEKRKPTK